MPASAYGLVLLFVAVSALSGVLAAWVIGPRRWWAGVAPGIGAFTVLYLLGHRWAIEVGPQVTVFGWQISLPFEVAVAVGSALIAGAIQRAAMALLQPDQRRARRDGLA